MASLGDDESVVSASGMVEFSPPPTETSGEEETSTGSSSSDSAEIAGMDIAECISLKKQK